MSSDREFTAYVAWLSDDDAAFEGPFSSVYRVPPDLEPVFREARALDREIMFTMQKGDLLTARLAPRPPLWARLGRRMERLRLDYYAWKRRRAAQARNTASDTSRSPRRR